MGKKLIKNLLNNNYYYKMLRWCIRHINNVTTIKIVNRKFHIFCDKEFKYFPTNQLIYLWTDLNITDKRLQCLPNLTHLYSYSNTNITDKGLQYLPNLTDFFFDRNI